MHYEWFGHLFRAILLEYMAVIVLGFGFSAGREVCSLHT